MLYLINLRKHSSQVELDQFFETLKPQGHTATSVTKSAFFQARKQLSHHAFIDLNDQVIDTIYDQAESFNHWKNYRLCAIDGTTVRLPHEPDIVETFGVQKGRAGQADCALGMGSVFYDVLNHLVIDSALHPSHTSEKQCAADHLSRSRDNDLVLYDRGYNAFWLYALHRKLDRDFCMRAKVRQCRLIQAFVDSGKTEEIITMTANRPSQRTCQEKDLSTSPVTLRLVRVELPNEVEVLITNVLDCEKIAADEFKALYHLRWGIEENYKRLKQWVEIENFSGKSALSVEQDFYAKILAANLTALVRLAAQEMVAEKTRQCHLDYQVNFAQALSTMKHRLIELILDLKTNLEAFIQITISTMAKHIEAVRPGRKAPRKLKNIKNNLHFGAYKCSL